MSFVPTLFRYISLTALAFMMVGLYRPWAMLWWEDVQNRRKVITLYGGIALASFLLAKLLILFIS